MTQGSELERLEKYVGKLLDNYSALKKSSLVLQRQLVEKENRIKDLEQQLSTMGSDQGEISKRVNNLIGMIEEWEKEVVPPFQADEPEINKQQEEVEDSPESRQQNLFTIE